MLSNDPLERLRVAWYFLLFMFSAGEGFTCTDAHFQVTRAAEAPACEGNGKGKAKHKGNGKECFADHATPLSMASSLRIARVACAFHPARTPYHAFGFSFSIFSACAISAFSVALFVVMFVVWFGLVSLEHR
jgi:hypothetical protein